MINSDGVTVISKIITQPVNTLWGKRGFRFQKMFKFPCHFIHEEFLFAIYTAKEGIVLKFGCWQLIKKRGEGF